MTEPSLRASLPTLLSASVAIASLAIVALAPTAAAQQRIVVPAGAATEDQIAESYAPFTFDAIRMQQMWDGAHIAPNVAVIGGIAFRQEAKGTAYSGITFPNLTLSFAYSSLTPATMSATFAANVTGQPMVVASGPYNLPPLPAARGVGPWLSIPLSAPFAYLRPQGNLLLEVVVPGIANAQAPNMVDAVRSSVVDTVESFGSTGANPGNGHGILQLSTTLNAAGRSP